MRSRTSRRLLIVIAALLASMVVSVAGADAVVVDMNPAAAGQSTVTYPTDQSDYYGVALVPGGTSLETAGIPAVSTGGTCTDPDLSADLGGPTLPSDGLCFHSDGSVLHQNETFAFTWDPDRTYFSGTRSYMEQFLSNVAAGSGTLSSPYAVTSQYQDASGRAANTSLYGGGCIDYGSTGGYTCKFDDTTGSGAGWNYPASDCPVTGTNQVAEGPGGGFGDGDNFACITDSDVRGELTSMLNATGVVSSGGAVGHTQAGYTPLITMLTPPGVVVCLNSGGKLCSANATAVAPAAGEPLVGTSPSASTAEFCSYHGHIDIGGTDVAYVVQPWTAETGCDEPDAPVIPANPTAAVLDSDVGAQMVSPLSQASMAAITDPALNGWFAQDGAEINDNGGCTPLGNQVDAVTVDGTPYYLQREFNNAGVIETDPIAPECAPLVNLSPAFVLPSSVDPGTAVQFDGSTTQSSLLVPSADYRWNFGDGTTAVGPSVVHTFSKAGVYTVSLAVTDRGGYTANASQTYTILGASGAPSTATSTSTSTTPTGPGSTKPAAKQKLTVTVQLLPQSLKSVFKTGLSVDVLSSEAANGLASVWISRAAARQAHMTIGKGSGPVRIGVGTLNTVKAGTVTLELKLSNKVITHLKRLRKVRLTVRLTLISSNGEHMVIDVAGRY
jgi:hypothetical protein